jgi:hypothetical protein
MWIGVESAARRMLERARHPQMNKEVPPALESDNQILAATAHLADALTLERGRDELGGLWSRQPWVADRDALETAPCQRRGEPLTDRLDLG